MLSYYVGFHQAYSYGVQPFYLVETIKLVVLAAIIPFCWRAKIKQNV